MVVLEPEHLPDVRSDDDLVADAQSGSAAAFAELYRRHHGRILTHCRNRIGGNDAADAAQETFLRAWRGLEGFAGERRFAAWLRTIATNVCIDVLRRRGRSVPVGDVDGVAVDDEPEVGPTVLHVEAMTEALARLSERHRAIIQLREYEGWSYQRIADHERLDLSAVKSLVWRARQSLRREFFAVNEGRLAGLLGLGSLTRLRELFDGLGLGGGVAVAGAGATAVVAALVVPTMAAGPSAPPPPPAVVVTTTTTVPLPAALPIRARVRATAAAPTTTTVAPPTTVPPTTTTSSTSTTVEARHEPAPEDHARPDEAKAAKEELRAEVKGAKDEAHAEAKDAKDEAKVAKDEAKSARGEAKVADDEAPRPDEHGSRGRGGRDGA